MTQAIQLKKTDHWLAKRLPFYYGMMITPVSIITIVATSPGQTLMISVFNPRFLADLNISLSQLSWAYMVGTLLASLPQSYLGNWMDKIGWQKMLVTVTILFSLACFYTSFVQNLFMLFTAFLFLRMLGQGALNLIGSNMLAMWFKERLGTIAGISGVLVSLLIGLVPLGALTLINQVGWRKTYIISGGIVLAVMLPISIFIYVSRPEDIGEIVDGRNRINSKENYELDELENNRNSFSLVEAMKTRSFWILTLIASFWAAIATAITFNILPIFTGKGLTDLQAAATFTYLSIIVAVTRVVGGYLADKISLNILTVIAVLSYAFGTFALFILPNSIVVITYILFTGIAQGFLSGVFSTIWVRYYGRKNLGKINGVVWTATAASSSVGPLLIGISFDHFGDYQFSLMIVAIFFLILSISSFWATPPKKISQNIN